MKIDKDELICKYNSEMEKHGFRIPPVMMATDTYDMLRKVGYNENKDATVGNISAGQEITLTSDKEYYAITKSEVKTLTATFNLNGAVSQDDDTSSYVTRSCNIKAIGLGGLMVSLLVQRTYTYM